MRPGLSLLEEQPFGIGAEGGSQGTVAIAGEGRSEHVAEHLATVGPVCAP